ncbi:Arylsulfatase precursor [Rubripirellula lacrimiformis]|uniref:Arylsulfatase n=1 Tax=Rubripirellula lacrimiformis TaxID=1930273 RepID=A0A517NKB6_9BACT|nr:sulfatase [Rubripirellula lacrimiformis]QDT07587.1 Arylsulfatase precursor [Rubripirellula lacrimiformis]
MNDGWMRLNCLGIAAVLAVGVMCGTGTAAREPNIVLILVDDLGWSDLGCYGHPWHQTPHIDQLAGEGMQYTQAYAPAPICSASRASILTGKTTARLNFEFVTKDKPGYQVLDADTPLIAPPFTLDLPLEETTIAEQISQSGYATAFFGKWHVSRHHQRYLGWSPTHGPRQQGFEFAEEDFGAHPYSYGSGRSKRVPDAITAPGQFPSDSMVDRVCDYLSKPKSKPFFLMVSEFYVHTPVHTPCQWIVDRLQKQIPPDAVRRDERIQYGAFVQTLDHHVGRILDALQQSGASEDTLVVFMSDNGGHPEYAANGPLRGSKWNLYEGGVRVPMIARWQGRIPPRQICQTPVVGYDLMPTFVKLAGGDPVPTDGVDISPTFDGQTEIEAREIVWHFPYYHPEKGFKRAPQSIGVDDFVTSQTRPVSAIRRGDYKLLHYWEDDRCELFHLPSDLSEQRDLCQVDPQRTAAMLAQLQKQLTQMDARLPQPSSAAP